MKQMFLTVDLREAEIEGLEERRMMMLFKSQTREPCSGSGHFLQRSLRFVRILSIQNARQMRSGLRYSS